MIIQENGSKGRWKIEKGKVHIIGDTGRTFSILRVNKNGNLTIVSDRGKDIPKKHQPTFKKFIRGTIAGIYEGKASDGSSGAMILYQNGRLGVYSPVEQPGVVLTSNRPITKWRRAANNEIHTEGRDGIRGIIRIEPNGDLTFTARLKGGKREEIPKEYQMLWKKTFKYIPVNAPVQPVRKLTAEEKRVAALRLWSVAGTYEQKKFGNTLKLVLIENGIIEVYINGMRGDISALVDRFLPQIELGSKWVISKEGEIHLITPGGIAVFRSNKDDSITFIAAIYKDGKRGNFPKEEQSTLKKIK